MTSLARAVLSVLCLSLVPLQASLAEIDIGGLMARSEAPQGVVFEIAEADESALERMLPEIRSSIVTLRARFPQTEFAVVSHGREQFALQSAYRDVRQAVHERVRSLVADEVPVHVCGTHAGWYGVTPEDFPEYVDVAPSGPGQIRLYRELGYELILVQ